MRVAGVQTLPATSLCIDQGYSLGTTSSPPPSSNSRPPIERNPEEYASNAAGVMPTKPTETLPFASALHLAAPVQETAGENTSQDVTTWPRQGQGSAASFHCEGRTLQPASTRQFKPQEANMPGLERPALAPKPAATAADLNSSQWPTASEVRLPEQTDQTATAEADNVGGTLSLEVRSSDEVFACPGTSADTKTNDLSTEISQPATQTAATGAPQYWWLYKDFEGTAQGPFSPAQMTTWFLQGFIPMNLTLKRVCDESFKDLGTLMKICKGVPFASDFSESMPPQP